MAWCLVKHRDNFTFTFAVNRTVHFEISGDKSRRMRWAGNVARTGEMNAYNILVGKAERMGPLRRRSRR
jgi:hypothetical protein